MIKKEDICRRYTRTGLIVVFLMVALVSIVSLQYTASQSEPCTLEWFASADTKDTDTLAYCSSLNATRTMNMVDQKMTEVALRPTVTPDQGPTVQPQPTPDQTAVLQSIPPEFQQIVAVDWREAADVPELLRDSSSMWQIGAVPILGEDDFAVLYILARRPEDGRYAEIAMVPSDGFTKEEFFHAYSSSWEAPQDIGTIIIQAISEVKIASGEINGIVHFSTSTGLTGTLDMKTGKWQFAP